MRGDSAISRYQFTRGLCLVLVCFWGIWGGLISFCLKMSNTEQLHTGSCSSSSAALTTLASASGVLGRGGGGGGLISFCLTTSMTHNSINAYNPIVVCQCSFIEATPKPRPCFRLAKRRKKQKQKTNSNHDTMTKEQHKGGACARLSPKTTTDKAEAIVFFGKI